ncbi:MAG TPA: molybdate ABC transporter substrate-binding protein [Thermoanaerobaculia bacterium]|nr:molybdate ABC transporter substrate-binding protein [Thermoanaerobaculia bacterium]
MLFRLALLATLALRLSAAEVRVFAAASLTDALNEIAAGYERASGDRIVFNFGASSTLARQIQEGAPADLFLSADEEKVNALARRGLIAARTSVLSNTLVIVVPARGGKSVTAARELAALSSIALAEPSSVPAGIYAKQYLTAQKVWAQLAPKVVPTDNVRSALAAVASGNVDAAIVYKTDALLSKAVRVAYEVKNGPPISYPFAVLKEAEEPVAARKFFAHLRSNAARAVFAKHGFIVR